MRQIVLIQPPFVQLNSPYPAPYYLKSFLEQRGFEVTVLDHSIGLFERIFSRSGLERIFADAADGSGASPGSRPSGASGKRGRNRIAAEIAERFFSEKELWLASIDRLVAFLRGRDPEWGHFLALANGCVPGGPRLDAYLAQRQGEVLPDEAKLLATWLLDDLADFISFSLDRGFSLIRYAPVHYAPVMEASLNSGFRDFAAVEKSLGANSSAAYIMHTFYRPMLEEEWERLEKGGTCISGGGSAPFLLGLTIPFPGCLSGALVCAESAKKRFGSAVYTVAGGGFVNTELRFLNAPGFFDYFDYVSLDKGYGSLAAILEHAGAGGKNAPPHEAGAPLYKTLYRFQGTVVAPPGNYLLTENKELEDQAVRTIFPDYSAVDFSRYLYPVDDTNPMHRLWSDGHWLKAYLAYGCYWHHCAFCDVTLDYIRSFVPVDPAALFAHLKDQADKTGVRGIHLVDEAAPVSSLLEFALLNREAGLPLSFWGNIRFEKDFTADTAAILAAGGLMGVSAGLEVATERGFQRLGKGIDLGSSVRACAAF
ncbi:MAG: radical SAM protein, partial [Treponema sp.]|nr:radical SAM protein [Treponema sp.]